jgi:hypothetical protein
LTEERFHHLADDALETLQEQLDVIVEDKLADGDVSLEVCNCCITLLGMMHAVHRACALAGWRPHGFVWEPRHVRVEQAGSQQADLVVITG